MTKAEDEQKVGDMRGSDLAAARQRELRPLLEKFRRIGAQVEAASSRQNIHRVTV